MTDTTNALVNLGELSKPATVFIEKISEAIGGVFKPYQIRRIAKAEAEAKKIAAVADLKIQALQHRALRRFLSEETMKQINIENIIRKAIPGLATNARPQDVEKDWIVNFFDKSKLISDEKMQELWSKILAGEGNSPGTFSKRTINQMSSMDKVDATLFENLCAFIWKIGEPQPLIYDCQKDIYTKNGISFDRLKHLDCIGLISFESLAGYALTGLNKIVKVSYQNKHLVIELPKENDNEIQIGQALLTMPGKELSIICKAAKIDGFEEYVLEQWKNQGIKEHVPGQTKQ